MKIKTEGRRNKEEGRLKALICNFLPLYGTIFLLQFSFCNCLYSASLVRINEIAVNISGGKDWVEIYNASGGDINLDQWSVEAAKLSGGSNPCKTFPAVMISSGAYIVLRFNDSSADETSGDANGNGYLEFYTGVGITGLTGTDNVVVLKDSLSDIKDAVAYCDNSGSWTAGLTLFLEAISASQWTGAGAEEDAATLGSSASKSLARNDNSTDTDADGVAKTDWQVTSQRTPGFKNPAFPPPPPAGAGFIYGKITEVAPGISGGDFIEIYISSSSNVAGAKLYEGKTLIKTFPNMTVSTGTFIVLNASVVGEDETAGDINGNGFVDMYSDESTPGLTGTDNNFTLKNADDTIVDFISFADDSSSYTGEQSTYDTAIATGQWRHPSDVTEAVGSENYYIKGSVAWSGSTKNSISRKLDAASSTGQPQDTNTLNDWFEGAATKGQGAFGSAAKSTTKIMEVFQSPFSPKFGEGKYSNCVIAYNVGENSQVTVRVFDTTGRLVKILLDHVDVPAGSNTVNWNGKDEDSSVVSVGLYIVNIEIQNKKTGKIKMESARAVVARKI